MPARDSKSQDSSKKTANSISLFVPMHSENWALALSRGYLGIPPTADAVRDIQVKNPGGVVGFASGPPAWAMQCEEPGAMVVLVISVTGIDNVTEKEPVFIPGLLRVSRVEQVRFSSQADIENFFASYSAFPDVPTDLVEALVFLEPVDLFDGTEHVAHSIATRPPDDIDASSRDFFCGLSAGLLQLLEAGKFDDEVENFFLLLRDQGTNIPVEFHADALLEAFYPDAKTVDRTIWTALVLVLTKTRGRHGFDRLDLIDQIENHITSLGEKSEGVETWLEVARDVVSARRDPTPLNDEGSVGQRASLAFLLAHEPEAIGYLEAGPRVSALVSLLALAYQGFARADVSFKRPVSRMDTVLTIAEALEAGDVKEFCADIGHLDLQMNERDIFYLNGKAIVERERDISPYRLMLRARALEARMELLVDEKLGLLFVETPGANSLKIFIDEDPSSRRGQPVVRFWAPLVEMKAKKPNAGEVRKLLERSWETGCALGVHTFDGSQHLCAFVTQLTNTLDRDEFDAHVENIGRMAVSM